MGRRIDRFFEGHPWRIRVFAVMFAGTFVAMELDELDRARSQWPNATFMKAVAIGAIVGTLLLLALVLAWKRIMRTGATDENYEARRRLGLIGVAALFIGWLMTRQSRYTPDPPITSLAQVGAMAFVGTCAVWLCLGALYVLLRAANRP